MWRHQAAHIYLNTGSGTWSKVIFICVLWFSPAITYRSSREHVFDDYTLTFCGLVTPFGDIYLRQHWLRLWLVAWWHQAITWTNVDLLSVHFNDIYLRAILQATYQPAITKINLKIIYIKFCSNLPGTNELKFTTTSPCGQWVNQMVRY